MSRRLSLVIGLFFTTLPLIRAQGLVPLADTVRRYDYTGRTHFPMGTFDYFREDAGDFLTKWYDENLTALEEPRIFDMAGTDEVYRFTWLRTWHNPIALRLAISGERSTLEWKRADGASGYKLGGLAQQGSTLLTTEEVDSFRKALTDLGFWEMPTKVFEHGCDGAVWILEAKLPGRYHAVDRWSPDKSGAYAKCCMLLLEYSGLRSVGPKY